MHAYVCILQINKLDSRSRNKFEWRKFRNQSALIVIILETIVADLLSFVFRVEKNLDGHRFKVDCTFENNCKAMTDNTEYIILTTGNKEDRLTSRKIPKIVAGISGKRNEM